MLRVRMTLREVKQQAFVLIRAFLIEVLNIGPLNDVGLQLANQMIMSQLRCEAPLVIGEEMVIQRLLVLFLLFAIQTLHAMHRKLFSRHSVRDFVNLGANIITLGFVSG